MQNLADRLRNDLKQIEIREAKGVSNFNVLFKNLQNSKLKLKPKISSSDTNLNPKKIVKVTVRILILISLQGKATFRILMSFLNLQNSKCMQKTLKGNAKSGKIRIQNTLLKKSKIKYERTIKKKDKH